MAAASGQNYILCIVSYLDREVPEFKLIRDPHAAFGKVASCETRVQVSYAIPRAFLV